LIIGDIHIGVPQEAEKDLHVNSLMITVCGECVSKDDKV
jgi:hypothetical protein